MYFICHQIAFRQYNSDKPAKYGLLSRSLNSTGLPSQVGFNEFYNFNEFYKRNPSHAKALVKGT